MSSERVSAWRICDRQHANTAMDGAGAARYGGRWNSVGVPMVYLAGSRALAQLEMRVHCQMMTAPTSHVMLEVAFPRAAVRSMKVAELPPRWRGYPAPAALSEIGDGWAKEQRSMVLQVPSAIIPEEPNYLLNPLHPGAKSIQVSEPHAVVYDARLFTTGM